MYIYIYIYIYNIQDAMKGLRMFQAFVLAGYTIFLFFVRAVCLLWRAPPEKRFRKKIQIVFSEFYCVGGA